MIDRLIEEGSSLQVQDGSIGQMLSGVEFETWAAKTILFLERKLPNSSLTEKAIEVNKRLNTGSYANYQFLLGVLQAAKDELSEQEREAARIADAFNGLY